MHQADPGLGSSILQLGNVSSGQHFPEWYKIWHWIGNQCFSAVSDIIHSIQYLRRSFFTLVRMVQRSGDYCDRSHRPKFRKQPQLFPLSHLICRTSHKFFHLS